MQRTRRPALAVRSHRSLRRSPRAVWRLLRLTPLGAGVALLAGLPAISAWAQTTGVAANVIKPDGRTATQQQVMGTRTDITTGTVKGDNAFNSFSRFEVGQGQTVNVHVPTTAQRVINIVTDAPVKVDGVLNGLKDGSISGNLVFADPMGMVVSKGGVVNVNSLQVVATTRAHADAMLDGQGRIGDAAVQQLLDGKAPRSAEGRVQIDGKINALDRVRIEARRIDIDGRIKAGVDAAHDAAFRAAVSSNGLANATGMVERGGVIELIADDAIHVAGTLDASQRQPVAAPEAPQAGVGGTVKLLADTIELAPTAHIDVSGLAGGGVAVIGSMSVPAAAADAPAATPDAPVTQTLVAATGSVVQADAIERGDGGRIQYLSDGSTDWGGTGSSRGGALMGHGGFIEVSGRRRVQLHGLVDTSAPKGDFGTLLIDPDDLTIVNGANGNSNCLANGSTGACSVTTGTIATLAANANLVLQADNSITLGGSDGSAATLDLSSALNAGSKGISFTSKDITFNANSKLVTGGGFVKLIALGGQSTGDLGTGKFSYDSSIGIGPLSIGQQVKGGTILMKTGSAIITRGVASGDAATAALVRNAGDVTLRGATVQMDAGSSILAQAESGSAFTGGAVELTAYSLQQWNMGKATAISQMTLGGTVKANAITVNSVARAEASPDGLWGFAIQAIQTSIGALTGMNAAYHETQADATIEVQGTAVLDAKTTLDIAAASVNKAAGSVKVFTVDASGNNLASAAAIYVKTAGQADLQIKNNAQLTSGGKTTLGAYNDATAKSSVKVLSNNSIGGVVVGYMAADVSANANVEAGAKLNVGSLELAALQTGNMRNQANSTVAQQEQKEGQPAPATASVGASVAISDIKAHATANLGANLNNVGNVTVVADSSLWQNFIAARNDVGGDPTIGDKVTMAVAAKLLPFASQQGKLTAWLADKFDALGNLAKGSPPIKAGAVVTVNETDLDAKAHIGNGAQITSTGQVAVVAQTEDRSVHNVAESKVNTKNSPDTAPVVNAAAAVGLYKHGAEATVGENAVINAKAFGSYADVYQPLDVTWLAGFSTDGLRDPGDLFKHFAPPNFGMPQFVFTSWATALSEQADIKDANGKDTIAIAGSVNWTSFTNTAKSWVGSGAKITTTDADHAWSVSWKAPTAPLLDGDQSMNGDPANAASNILLETQDALGTVSGLAKNAIGEITGFFNGGPVVLGITLRNSLSFDKALDVKARNQSAFLTFTGQPVDFGMSSVNLGSQGGKAAVGGAFNYAGAEHTTVAGIDDGAVVKATAGTVSVDALSQDRIISIAPTAGTGKGYAANLIAAYSELDNTTVAVLSNKADVQAKGLAVNATEDVSVWSAAGAAAFGASTAAVGLAVAVNELDGRTLATIGNPGSLSVGQVRPDGFSGASGTGAIDAPVVTVRGLTQGTSGAVAASAASVATEDSSQNQDQDPDKDKQIEKDDKNALSKKWEALKGKTSGLRDAAVTKLLSTDTGKIASLRNKLAEKIQGKEQASAPDKPYQTTKFSFAAAGSATVNLGNLDTSSVVDTAALQNKATKPAGSTDASVLDVRAVNDTHQYSVSGSLALLKLNAPETKTGYGVSGAIAIDLENNDTLARITDSTVKDYGQVDVESLASGQRISVGMGIAGSSGSKPAYMLSASYSMTDSDNSTVSAIEGGKISSSNDAFRTAVDVLSYDKTETGVGAGALTVQTSKAKGGGAAGASIGVALVHNDVESRIAGMDSDKLSSVDVRAYDPVVLGIGAASLGISTDKKSTTIEGSVTYGEVENTTRAVVTDRNNVASTLKAAGAVTVQATDLTPDAYKTRFTTILASDGTPAADSTYDFGASLRSGDQESFGSQSIGTSQPGALVIGVAGGIAVTAGNSVGASAALSRVANVHESLIEGATVNADTVKVDATDATLMVNVGIGVAGTGTKTAIAGSVALTIDDTRATARVGTSGKTTSVTTTGSGGLGVTSATSDKAFAIAGAVGISTKGSAGGIAGTVGVDGSVAEAQIQNATVNTGSAATRVQGTTSSQHVSVAAAGGYGANASINGSFVINFETARTTASISDSGITAASLSVKAGDDAALASQVYTGSGSLGFSKDVAGGAALTSNTVALTRDATIDRATLTLGSGTLEVQADSSVKMIGVTIAGGGSKDVAFNGAISSNEIANKTTARVAGSTVTTTGDVSVLAGDRSEMDYGTGAVSVSNATAIGAAIAFNLITNDVTAQVQGTDTNGNKRGTGVANVGNLRVGASSDEKIVNAAYGVAIGSEVGGAGSVAVNVIDSDVTAHIGRGADIHADGSVAVTATAQDDIKSFGGALGLGAGAGVGLSSTVNVVRGGTEASVGADDESVVKLDAKGNGAGLAVNNGTLTQALPGVAAPGSDPTGFDGMAAMKDYDVTRAKMTEGTTTVKGLAVNATSLRHVLSFDTNVGGSEDGVGIGANAGAHVISSKTTADIANASVNQRDTGNVAQDVAIKATSHHVMSTFGFSAGGASGGGGAAALGGDVFLTQTTAQLRDSQVKAAGDVTVKAGNESAQSGILAGIAAAGGGSLAGSTGVIVFDAGVEASILGGTTRAGDDVAVNASNTSVMNTITGAGALSGGLALSGAVTVLVADLATHAYIGRDTDSGQPTKVSSGGDVEIKADSTTQVNTFTFAVSGGAATSVAAIGAVGVITNDTTASARHADLEVGVPTNWVYAANNSGPGTGDIGETAGNGGTTSGAPTGKLTISATDHGVVNQLSGAAGINFVTGGGVGGTVSVMVAKSNVSAELKSSEVDTKDLSVTSLNSQDQLAATVGVGGAADVGAGFAISLTMTGTGSPGSDAFGNANDSNSLGTKLMGRASSIASANRLGETADTLSASDRATLQSQSSRDISKTLTNSGANSAAAFIDASVVRADHDVTVNAGQETALKNIAGAAGVGGIAGVGGTVGVSVVHNASAAQVTSSNITAGGALQVKADSADKASKHALDLLTFAGGAGFAGLGASVGVGQLENQVSAQASGTLKAASVSLIATDSTSAKAENVAAAVGGGALGIAVSTLDRSGTVQAWVNKAGSSGQSIDAGSLSISASTAQDNDVISRAVAAGMVASGNGAAGTINDTVGVSAGIGDGSTIHVGGIDAASGRPVTVTATRGATLDSGAEGVGVSGGVQIGASVAIAKMGGYTEAKVGNNVTFDAGGTLAVVASEDAGNTVTAAGSASGGGTLVGANATVAQSENAAQVRASIGDGTLLPDGAVAVHATHAGTQHAESFGVTVGGLLAVGANTSDAKTSATTSATLGNVRTSATRLGDLDVAAQGLDITTAKAVAGGGGLISGQAATALVNDTTSTTATISAAGTTALANPTDYTLRGGALTVDATHAAQVRADSDTVNASAVGASGAITLTDLNNSAMASIGDGVRLRGLGIALTSANLGNETGSGDNAAGAGGGVANGSAVVAKTNFVTQSSTTIGNGAKLDVVGDPSSEQVGRLVIVAGTDLATHTQGSLNTGGVIDIPYAEIESTTDAKNNVTIGTGAELRSAGDLILGTSVLNRTSASALVKTYGGIGITGGKSTANAKQTDRIQLNTNALLQAYGNVSIATGRNADNAVNLMQSKAVTDVYNNTAIPVSYQNPANANITQDSGLSLAAGSQVLAGRSVYLRTFKGDQIVSAAGEGHNPYLDLFSTSTSDSNPSQSFTGSAALNGTVTAGYYRMRDLTIDRSGNLSQHVDTADNTLPVLTFTMVGADKYLNAANQQVATSAVLKPQGYIAKVNGFNPSLYYDDNAKTKLGGVPNAAMGAYVLPDLVVAGGNVEVDATTVSGNGTLRAQGGPMIKVDNQSNRYLIANTLVIPDIDSGGGVSFTGSGAKPASLTVQQIDKGRTPTIDLHNSYDTAFGGLASDIVLQSNGGGANTVRNLRGSFRMVNDNGNVWGSAPEALTVDIQVPKGTYVIESDGYEPIGGAPQGIWAATDALYRPNDIGSFVDTAAYAFYVANFSNPSSNNNTYSYQLQGIVNNGGNGGTGYLFRPNLGNQPTSGGNWYAGRYNFDILPVKTLSNTRSGTPLGATKSPGLLANRVDITAAYIDINADIRAGTARDIDVTITNAKPFAQLGWLGGPQMSFFDCVADNTCRNFNGLYAEANGLYKVPAAALSYGANSPQLTVTYDPSTKRVSTAPIGTASVGAISLIGRILNSNADGSARSKIELSTGTLQLNVNNQSGYAFEMPRIETGGASGDGVIRITDLNKLNAQYKPLTSWWVSKNGTDVKLYQSFTASTYNDPLNPLTAVTSGNGAALGTYDPQGGWRYEWTRSASASRSFTHPTGANAWWDYYATPWSFAYGASTPAWSEAYNAHPVYAPGNTNAYSTQLSQSTGFSGAWNVTYSANGPASRSWYVATNVTLYQKSSVRADYGMDISFKGYASGGVTFTSNADTYLSNTLNNPTGDTTLTLTNGASLIARDGGLIRSRNLTLNAAGNIGGIGQSKALDVDTSGWLNAHSDGNMAINAAGALNLARADVGDGRQLKLKAVGDITTTGNTVTLTGYDVDLTSVGGRIGGATGSMNVNVKGIGNSVSQRGLLTVSSNGDIALNLTGGDTRVAALTAADGNVTINTNGSLFDAKEAQGTSGRTDTELQALWEQTLKISGSKAASVQDYLQHTITPLDQQVNRTYRDYWALRALGQLNGAGTQITLNATGLATLRAQTAAALNVANPGDAQVNQWANTLLGRYADTFARMLGSSWRSQTAFQTQDGSYRFSADRYNEYWTLRNATDANHQLTAAGRDAIRQVAATVIGGTPTDAQLQAYVDQRLNKLATDFTGALGSGWAGQAAFTTYQADYRLAADTLLNTYAFGTYWGSERLQNEIRATAFGNANTGSGTSVDHLNISGRRVTLTSSASNATLGRDNGYLTVTLGQPLSDMQRYALAQASAPGDVQVITNGAGQITGLKVKDTRPFFVNAKTQFDAFAPGQLYVLAQGALAIGSVQSGGALRLSAQDGITNAGAATAIKGSSLVLDGGNGSLGTSTSPLLIGTAELSLARASGSVYLRQPNGNLVIDVVGAGRDVVLTLDNGSLAQKQQDLLSLAGESLTLNVSGDVGSAARPLVLEARSGPLTLKARDAWINGTGTELQVGNSTLRNFTLRALGTTDVELAGDVMSDNALQWLIGGDFIADAGKQLRSRTDLSLTASSVDTASGSSLVSTNGALALYSSAGPTVLSTLTARTGMTVDSELAAIRTRDANVTLTVQNAGGSLKFNGLNNAGGGIGGVAGGDTGAALRVAADRVSLRSANGDASLRLLNGNVTVDNAAITAGSLKLDAAGQLALAAGASAGQDLTLTAAQALTLAANRTASAGRNLTMDAASLTMGAGSRATAGDSGTLLARSGNAALATVQVANNLAIDAASGVISQAGTADQFTATAANGRIALNAGNTGGLGLGSATVPLRLSADRISARTAAGNVQLALLKAATLEAAVANAGDVTLTANGNLTTTGAVSASCNTRLTVTGQLVAARDIAAGQDLTLRATTLDLAGPLQAGRDAVLTATNGDLLVHDRLAAAGNATLTASGAMLANNLQAGLDLGLDAGGPVRGDVLRAGRALTATRATDFTLRDASSGTLMSLNVGNAHLDHLAAGGPLTLVATIAQLGDATSTGDVTLTTQGALAITGLTGLSSGGATHLTADGLTATRIASVGNVDITAGASRIDTLTTQRDATLGVQTLDVSQADIGGRFALTAGSADMGQLTVDGDALLTTTGTMTLANLAANRADVSADLAYLAQLALRADAHLRATRNLRVDTATTGTTLDAQAGSLQLGTLRSGGNATLAATSLLELARLTSAGAATLSATTMDVGSMEAARDVDLTARMASVSSLVSHGDARVTAPDALTLDAATVDGALTVNASSARLGNLTAGGNATLNATGAMTLTGLTTAGTATLTADTLTAGHLESTGNADLTARTAHVSTLLSNGDARLQMAEALQLDAATVDGHLTLTSSSANLGNLAVGLNATLTATGPMTLTALTAGGFANLTADTLTAGRIQATGVTTLAARTMDVTTLQAGADASLRATDSLTLGTATIAGALDATAGSADLGTLTVGGDAQVTSRAGLALAALSAGHNATLTATGPMTLTALTAGGFANLTADTLTAGRIQATGVTTLAARTMDVATLQAGADASLRATDSLTLGAATIAGALDATAGSADLGTLTVGGGTLKSRRARGLSLASLTGGGAVQLAADTATLGLIASQGNVTLDARTAAVSSLRAGAAAQLRAAQSLALADATVAGQLAITTGTATLGNVHAVGNATLQATGPLRLDAGTFDANLNATADTTTFGQVQVAGTADLRTAGLLKVAALDVGRTLAATAGSIDGNRLHAAGNATLTASGDVALATGDFGADLQLAANAARLGTWSVAGNSTFALRSGVSMDRLTAVGDLDLQATQFDLGTMTVGGNAHLATPGSLRLGSGRIAGTLTLDAADATLGNLSVGTDATLAVTNALSVDTLDAGRTLALQAGTLHAGNVTAGGDARLAVGNALTLANGQFGGTLVLNAAEATLGTLQTGGDATVQASGGLRVDHSLSAGGALALQADTLQANGLQAGGALTATTRVATVTDAVAGAALSLTGAERLQLDHGQAGATLALTGGTAVVGDASAGQAATVSAEALTAQGLTAGGSLTVQAGSAQIGTLASGGSTTLASRSDLTVGAATVGGALSASAGNASLTALTVAGDSTLAIDHQLTLAGSNAFGVSTQARAGDIAISGATFGGSASLTAGNALQADSLDARDALRVATGSATLNRVTAAGPLDIQVANDLTLNSLTARGATHLQAGNLQGSGWTTTALTLNATDASVAHLVASGAVDATATHTLSLDDARLASSLQAHADTLRLNNVSIGGAAALQGTGSIDAQGLNVTGALALTADQATLADTTANGAATLSAQNALTLNGGNHFQSTLTATAAQLALNAAEVAGDARLTSTGAADIAQLQVGHTATVTAGGNLTLGQLTATDAQLTANALTLTSAQVGQSLQATAAQDLTAGQLVAGQTLTLQSGGKVGAQLVQGPNVSIDASHDLMLDLLKTSSGSLRSATQIAIANGQADTLDLQAARIQGLLRANGDALITTLTGVDGATAENVALTVQAPRWQVPVLNTANAQFSSNGSYAQFDQVHLTNRMMLTTPQGLVGITAGTVKVLPSVDIQLFSRSGDFVLTRDGVMAYTSALGLLEKPGQRIAAPNSGLMPLAATGNGKGPKPSPAAQPGQLAMNFDALLRRAPTFAGGDDEDDGLVGTLEF